MHAHFGAVGGPDTGLSPPVGSGYSPGARGRGRTRPPPLLAGWEGPVYVACSTLCFGRHSLEDALRTIAELQFGKCDVAIHEQGRQLRPSEVAADVNAAAARLRHGPGLTPAAFSVEIDAPT